VCENGRIWRGAEAALNAFEVAQRPSIVPQVLYDNAIQLRNEAREQVKVLEERIRKAREALQDCAHDGMCGYGQRALAMLDGEGEKADEHFELTREEWEAAARSRLDELGVTYAELAQMNRDGVFETHQHQALWTLIGGTLDEQGQISTITDKRDEISVSGRESRHPYQ
jgi:hypothetical protein